MMANDLRLIPPPDPDAAFSRELEQMRAPRDGEQPHVTARRRALADAIETARRSWYRKERKS
jgi:hypothetical protein